MTYRQWVKQQRQQRLEEARATWRDREYGIKVAPWKKSVRLSWEPHTDPFFALMGLVFLRRLLVTIERDLVIGCRAHAIPWQEIGWALDISGEAARKRWPDADEAARAAGS